MSEATVEPWRGETSGVEATAAVGRAIGRLALAGDAVALRGELGAGKTQLVRGLAEGMGLDTAAVASPTFVLVHEYAARAGGPSALVLVHIDAYRIHSIEDLESIGWDIAGDAAGNELRRGAVVAVEWADRLGEALGAGVLDVRLEHAGEGRRRVTVTPPTAGGWRERWAELRASLATIPQR